MSLTTSQNQSLLVNTQDGTKDDIEDEVSQFVTPPSTPAIVRTAAQYPLPDSPLGSSEAYMSGGLGDFDMPGYQEEMEQEDYDDLASEEPISVENQPLRRIVRSTIRYDYKQLSTGKPSKTPKAMVTTPSIRITTPPSMVFLAIRAKEIQQKGIPRSFKEARNSQY
jgi:hypothetical protein